MYHLQQFKLDTSESQNIHEMRSKFTKDLKLNTRLKFRYSHLVYLKISNWTYLKDKST